MTTAGAALVSSMAETDERLPMLSEAAGDSPAQAPAEDIHKPVTTTQVIITDIYSTSTFLHAVYMPYHCYTCTCIYIC